MRNYQRDVSRVFLGTNARRGGLKRKHPVRTALGQWSHFDDAAVSQTRTLLGYSNSLGFVRYLKVEITADRFLRLCKGTVDHDVTTLAGNKLAHLAQWVTAFALALLNKRLEPSHPCGRDFLNLGVGELFEPGISAEEQQVVLLRLRVHG